MCVELLGDLQLTAWPADQPCSMNEWVNEWVIECWVINDQRRRHPSLHVNNVLAAQRRGINKQLQASIIRINSALETWQTAIIVNRIRCTHTHNALDSWPTNCHRRLLDIFARLNFSVVRCECDAAWIGCNMLTISTSNCSLFRLRLILFVSYWKSCENSSLGPYFLTAITCCNFTVFSAVLQSLRDFSFVCEDFFCRFNNLPSPQQRQQPVQKEEKCATINTTTAWLM